jgi:hypothetical protein
VLFASPPPRTTPLQGVFSLSNLRLGGCGGKLRLRSNFQQASNIACLFAMTAISLRRPVFMLGPVCKTIWACTSGILSLPGILSILYSSVSIYTAYKECVTSLSRQLVRGSYLSKMSQCGTPGASVRPKNVYDEIEPGPSGLGRKRKVQMESTTPPKQGRQTPPFGPSPTSRDKLYRRFIQHLLPHLKTEPEYIERLILPATGFCLDETLDDYCQASFGQLLTVTKNLQLLQTSLVELDDESDTLTLKSLLTEVTGRTIQRLVEGVEKDQLVRTVHVFKSRAALDRVLEELTNTRQGRAGPGILIISVHFEDQPHNTRGHVHFIHDCKRHKGSCRRTWIRAAGPVQFRKGVIWRWEWTGDVVLSQLLYLNSSGREITHMLLKNRRPSIPSYSALLSYRRHSVSSGSTEIPTSVCISDSPLGRKQQTSFINSSSGNGWDPRNGARGPALGEKNER